MSESERGNILSSIEVLIDHIQHVRKLLIGVSISALILAPFSIGLSIYLMTHPLFFQVLDQHDEFGLFLSILLGGIIVVSLIWLVAGMRQYYFLSSWNKRYQNYKKRKEQLDDTIKTQYNLGQDEQV